MQDRLRKTASVVGLGIALGMAAGGVAEDSYCGESHRFSGRGKNVYICKTEDGKVLAQGKGTPEVEIPVDSIYKVWRWWDGGGKVVGWYTNHKEYFSIYKTNLETGETVLESTWHSSSY